MTFDAVSHLDDSISAPLNTLLTSYSPPFIFLYDPESPRLSSSAINLVLEDLRSSFPTSEATAPLSCAAVNAVSCFTPRLFFDTVLNSLARWSPTWDDAARNWADDDGSGLRYNENFDTFIHGLKAISSHLALDKVPPVNSTRKGKGRVPATQQPESRLAIFVERAERLKDNLPELLVPLTRLAELAQLDIVTIFLSELRWEDFRPSLGASPEPFYMDVPALSKQDILVILRSSFPSPSSGSSLIDPDTYHPSLRPLHAHFTETLQSICWPFLHDTHELLYITAATWPGFVQPVLDAHRRDVEAHLADGGEAESAPALRPPTEDTRIRLVRLATPRITAALDVLYPRLTHAASWVRTHAPPPGMLSLLPAPVSFAAPEEDPADILKALPRLARFVLVAAFLASTNPARTDARMFGRGPDERRRRRRKGGSPRKGGAASTAVKVSQRLLGPMAFPLDRLLAILGVLLEENDVDARPPALEHSVPGEYTDMELLRVGLYTQVAELDAMRLLLRVSAGEKLDLTASFKCGVSYDVALRLARDLGIMLNDLMWDPV